MEAESCEAQRTTSARLKDGPTRSAARERGADGAPQPAHDERDTGERRFGVDKVLGTLTQAVSALAKRQARRRSAGRA